MVLVVGSVVLVRKIVLLGNVVVLAVLVVVLVIRRWLRTLKNILNMIFKISYVEMSNIS